MWTNVERSLVLIVARVRCRGRLWVPVLRTVCVLVVGSVAVAVPAPPILCFAPLSIVTARAEFGRFREFAPALARTT